MTIAPSQAAAELLARRGARESLIEFSLEVDIPGAPATEDDEEARFLPIETRVAAHHRLLMGALQRISETPGGRLMVFMPPGSAKSTYSSVVFPAWFMGRNPRSQIILASYATNLAKKHGRRCRQLVSSQKYRRLFDTTLSAESSAAHEWALTNGSEYMAGGLQSGITGNRADGLLIDDPVAGREEAESEPLRAKTFDAYVDDARSRIKPSGWRVIVQTRWNESDLAGMILPDNWAGESGRVLCKDGHYWEIICLPAEADRSDDPLGRKIGEGLWPEWFKPGHWDEFKFPPRSWLSLYQQKPTAESGTYIKREWLDPFRYKQAPAALSIYMTGDFAVSEDKGDYTDMIVWGVDKSDEIYVLASYYGQTTADAWIAALLDNVDRFKPLWFVGEAGVIRRSVEPFLNKAMTERRTFVATEWLPSTGDKAAMCRSFQALCSAHKVHFPEGQAWADRIIDQLLKFPAGRYDDAVDACSLFGRFIDKTWGAVVAPKPKQIVWDAPLMISDFEPRAA